MSGQRLPAKLSDLLKMSGQRLPAKLSDGNETFQRLPAKLG
jgi:hypothetical protein